MALLARSIPAAGPSAPFRVAPATYFRCAILRPGMGRTAIAITIAVATGLVVLALALADLRLALVALMVIFVAAPMVIAMVYFSIALSPEATATTLPHTAEIFSDGTLLLQYIAESEEKSPHAPEHFRSTDVSDKKLIGNNLVFTLASGRLIIIPLDALGLDRAEIIELT